jgi:hypothetical protein
VLTFIRAGWNNAAPAVSTSDVAKMRKADTRQAER